MESENNLEYIEKKVKTLKDEYRILFLELIEEEKGRIVSYSPYRKISDRDKFISIAKNLLSKAIELECFNKQFSTHELKSVYTKEMELLRLYSPKMKNGRMDNKSVNEIHGLMRNVIHHIKMFSHSVLDDVDCD